ncbi:MAG TPA: hypothetical protein PK225_02490 [Azonexus sp.]|nr:hypothetical protein [Azonexus sp.]
MNVFDAVYRVAHDFADRGAVGLAARIGKNAGTFLNEVSGTCETAKLGLGTAVAMSVAANDARILHAFADALGFVAVRRPAASAEAGDAALLDLFLSLDIREGMFAAAVQAALADGRVSPADLEDIQSQAYEAVRAIYEVRDRLAGLVDGRR